MSKVSGRKVRVAVTNFPAKGNPFVSAARATSDVERDRAALFFSPLPPRADTLACMIHRIFALVFLLAATAPLLRAEWKYSANRYDLRVATTAGSGTSPDGPMKAKLAVKFSPGKDGTITIEFIVEGARKMKGFGFDSYEGPDAAAADGKFTRIVVERPGAKPFTLLTKVGGWYLGDAFYFAATEPNSHPGDVQKTVRAIQNGATRVSVAVQDSRDAKKQLRADFATDVAADALEKLLK